MPRRHGLIAAVALYVATSAPAATVEGLDHVVVAVNDLDAAAADYRKLGFAIKLGRPHDNGIRNVHVKFADGTEIELITADAARDALTAKYRAHLAQGDGPAFLALYAPRGGGRTDFPYLFFGNRNASPTDRPEHFAHANTARSLVAVWLAVPDTKAASRELEALGGRAEGNALRFADGDIVLVAQAAARPIVRAVVTVADVATARRVLHANGIDVAEDDDAHLVLPPSRTHGLWLELRERR